MALGALQDGGVRPLQCLAQAAAYRRKVGTRGGAAEPNPGRRNQRGDPGTEELAPARAAANQFIVLLRQNGQLGRLESGLPGFRTWGTSRGCPADLIVWSRGSIRASVGGERSVTSEPCLGTRREKGNGCRRRGS